MQMRKQVPGLRCVARSVRPVEKETGCGLSKCGFDKVTEKEPPGRLVPRDPGATGKGDPLSQVLLPDSPVSPAGFYPLERDLWD